MRSFCCWDWRSCWSPDSKSSKRLLSRVAHQSSVEEIRGSAVSNDLREVSSLNSLPEVTITNTDRQRLVSMATAVLRSQRDGVAASMLLGEIARATVVLPEPLPPNAIVMNCDVEVRDSQRKPSSTCALSFLARRPWSTRSTGVDAHRRGACRPVRRRLKVHSCRG